jgi:phytoene desaturase
MNEIGVKIIKNDEVIKIITDKKKISGVTTKSNKTINAEIVVCNADPPFVYKYLLDEKQNTFLFEKKNKKDELFNGIICLLFWIQKEI